MAETSLDPPPSRSSAAKYHISEVALDLFLEQGFDNVTVDAVAAAAGVSRRTVFRHFCAKDEIPFPDHRDRQELHRAFLQNADPGADPLTVLGDATTLVLEDFLSHRDLVLKRYRLTQADSRVRDREIIENDRYMVHSRRFMRAVHTAGPESAADIIVNMFDAAHRSALANWVRSSGTTDPVAELRDSLDWVLSILRPSSQTPPAAGDLVLAVLPANDDTYAVLDRLRSQLTHGAGSALT
ncbi:MAG: TetR family transcriptional regulator [Nocardioidaceae bacterium]